MHKSNFNSNHVVNVKGFYLLLYSLAHKTLSIPLLKKDLCLKNTGSCLILFDFLDLPF